MEQNIAHIPSIRIFPAGWGIGGVYPVMQNYTTVADFRSSDIISDRFDFRSVSG